MRLFGFKGGFWLFCGAFVLFCLASLPQCHAQDVSGMTGTVTDQSGAAIPDATVILSNVTTGAKYLETTNATGLYRFANIPPGAGYEVTFTATGFAALQVKDIYLTVNEVRTQSATLTVGAHQEVIQVSASNAEVTIDTTDATVGNNIDVRALDNLPVQQRNTPTALFELQAGVSSTGAVAGARVDQNNVTLDGLDVNDFATGGAGQNNSAGGVDEGIRQQPIVGGSPVDSLEQFTGGIAGQQASSGPGGGGQFTLVTKGGTNTFHGNLNEYHRDPLLVANSWFGNNATPKVPRNHLIQNQFGGNIGGPIKRDKIFFFFDYNNSKIISSLLTQRTVPLGTLRGDNPGGPVLGYINSEGTNSYLNAAQVAAIDPAGIGFDNAWVGGFTSRFPKSNNMITGDGVNSGGYSFNAPNNDYDATYVGRGDWTINDKMTMFAKFALTRETAVQNSNEFEGDPLTDPFIDRSYNFVVGHTWLLSNSATNQFHFGETVQKVSFPDSYNPDGSTWFTFDDGTGPAIASSLYLQPAASARRVPIPLASDDFTWSKGAHTWQFGGTFKDILAHNTDIIDYNSVEEGMGGYTLSLCGPTAPGSTPACGYNAENAPLPDMRPSDLNQSAALGNQAEYDWDQAFAFVLARIGEVSSDFNYNKAGTALPQLTGDQRYYRYYQLQLYEQDTWKITPNVTASYGLSYQWLSVPYETRGLESTEPFTADQYIAARVQQSAASQTGPFAVPLIAYYLGGKGNGSGAPGLYKPQYLNLAPHVGFAWNPGFDKKMVINASGSVVYDRTVINAIQAIQDTDSYLFQQSLPTPEGIPGDPYDSFATGPRLDSHNSISTVSIAAPATPKPPYEPFVAAGVPYGLYTGSAFNATIDPSLKTPYEMIFNAGVQRQLPWDMVMKVNYVGRFGRRLIAQADVNQIIDFPDPVSGQMLSQAFGSLTQQLRHGVNPANVTPQPWFENVIGVANSPGFSSYTQFLAETWGPFAYRGDFGDTVQYLADNGAPLNVGSAAQFSENTFFGNKGFSTYHGALVTLQKNLSNGLTYDLNYTFSHSIDNVSFFANSMGDTGIGGVGLICDILRPRECRANSDFDVKQYVTSDANYVLPFGTGKTFGGNSSFLTNEFIGGWSLSGIGILHTGQAWGTDSNAFVASYSNNAPGILVGPKSAVATHVNYLQGGGVNIFANAANAAAAYTGPVGFQIGPRNGLRGPGYFNLDLGLGKTFPVTGEHVAFKFRADAFNALNHPNFDLPAENVYNGLDQQDITNSTFGDISYTVNPAGNLNNGARVLQLSLRLEF